MSSEAAVTTAVRRLFDARRVVVKLQGDRDPLVIDIDGDPVTPPPLWVGVVVTDGEELPRPHAAGLGQGGTPGAFELLGDQVHTTRLALRYFFFDPLSGTPTPTGVRLGPNLLWGALGLEQGSVLLDVDGDTVESPASLTQLAYRLCTADRIDLTLLQGGVRVHRTILVDGPPVTPP
jgi:S1-C subfamily serine protease